MYSYIHYHTAKNQNDATPPFEPTEILMNNIQLNDTQDEDTVLDDSNNILNENKNKNNNCLPDH